MSIYAGAPADRWNATAVAFGEMTRCTGALTEGGSKKGQVESVLWI